MPAQKKAQTRTRRASGKKSVAKKPVPKKAKAVSVRKKTASAKNKTPRSTKKLKPARKDTITKNDTQVTFPRTITLSALIASVTPVNPDQFAISVARYGGGFFVAVGALLTVVNLYAYNISLAQLSESTTQAAMVCDPTFDPNCTDDPYGGSGSSQNNIDPESGCDYSDTVCLDEYYNQSNTTAGSVDTTPSADFSVDHSDPLSGRVFVTVDVPDATHVQVELFSRSNKTHIPLGTAQSVSNTEWEILWDTTQFPDGEYKLYAYIDNMQGGLYQEHDDTYYVVENQQQTPLPPTTDTQSSTTVGTTVDDPDTTTDPTDTVEDDQSVLTITDITLDKKSPVSGPLEISIRTENADDVFVYMKEKDSSVTHAPIRAHYVKVDEWEYVLDTTNYTDGDYAMKIEAVDGQGGVVSDVVHVFIANTPYTPGTDDSYASSTNDEFVEDIYVNTDDLTPDTQIRIGQSSPIEGLVDLYIETDKATHVEVFVETKFSAIEKFIGTASQLDDRRWFLLWDTTHVPNNEYKLYAVVETPYGIFESEHELLAVFNPTDRVQTQDEATEVQTLHDVNDEVSQTSPPSPDDIEPNQEFDPTIEDTDDLDSEPETDTFDSDEAAGDFESEVVSRFEEFKFALDDLLQRLAAALRINDRRAVERVQADIDELRSAIVTSELPEEDSRWLLRRIDEHIEDAIVRVEEDIVLTEKIVQERTGESAIKDSDGDGITDFDEVTIFETDPFVADSDGDGFTDGAEILSGYNPKDDTPEALVEYESPKEVGIVREDILAVEEIVAVTSDVDDTDNVEEEAIIRGRGLPNSFVTLYIFSTPIVVTVKTEDDGSWMYRFDKELEDGEHEVYVGVTDNAGKIIAKSEPLRFVKQAQAFTPAEASAAATVTDDTDQVTLMTANFLLIILSISVVLIGLVLILLGLYLSKREDETPAHAQSEPALV